MRYAIYFTPPENDPLLVKAAHWLGRDAFTGAANLQIGLDGFDANEVKTITDEPRRYGFHATLKAPFELAAETSETELIDAFEQFAAETPAFEIPEIALGQLGHFFALVPAEKFEHLQQFAGECVERFERFRAPLSDADIARRKPENLPPSQRHNLVRWGYPYVFEDFRFHMTLTGPVASDRQSAVKELLQQTFHEFVGRPLRLGHIALFEEAERGAPFTVKHIAQLAADQQRKIA